MRPPIEALRHVFKLVGENVMRRGTGKIVRVLPGRRYTMVALRFEGSSYYIPYHRLKFYLAYGWLPESVDHKNRIRSDSRLANLRAATLAQNSANRSGTLGVRRQGRGWMAYAHKDNRQVYIGTFLCFGHAVRAAKDKRRELHGEFAGGHTTQAPGAP